MFVYAGAILPTGDGGFVAAGGAGHFYPVPPGGWMQDALVMEIRPSGLVDWQVMYEADPAKDCNNAMAALAPTQDGGYLTVGSVGKHEPLESHVLVMKLGHNGSVQWLKSYAGGDIDYGVGVIATDDAGFIIAADTRSSDYSHADVWVFKLNAAGSVVWQNTMGTTDIDHVGSIQATPDGGWTLVGYSGNDLDTGRAFAVKLDSNGRPEWSKSFSEHPNETKYSAEAYSVGCEPDGTSIVAGSCGYFGEHEESYTWVFKLDSSGKIIWQKKYRDVSQSRRIIKTTDGGYLIAGWGEATKLGPSGKLLWQKKFGGWNMGGINDAFQAEQGRLVMTGEMSAPARFLVICLTANGTTGSSCSFFQSGSPTQISGSASTGTASFVRHTTHARVQSLQYDPYPRTCQATTICAYFPD